MVSGPGNINKAIFLESVILMNKKDKIKLGKEKGHEIHYTIIDPVKYYVTLGIGNHGLLELVEKQIVTNALSGKVVNNKEQIYKMIEKMNLPIELDKNA